MIVINFFPTFSLNRPVHAFLSVLCTANDEGDFETCKMFSLNAIYYDTRIFSVFPILTSDVVSVIIGIIGVGRSKIYLNPVITILFGFMCPLR